MKPSLKHILRSCAPLFLLVFAYFAGQTAAYFSEKTAGVSAESQAVSTNWGLSFQEEGKAPIANASASFLSQYNAYYMEETDEKKIYLTFDCGFESGCTPAILDALKKHNAPATFFIVGNYLETSPDLVKRMVEEGHTVGNHTYHHPDMSKISSKEAFQEELQSLEALYEETIGQPMPKFYRPPQGIYSEANLQMACELGYQTFFWSLAYVDWYQDDQPSKDEAFSKLIPRIHPGAVVLLHNTSQTNAEILDELLTKWEDMGYTFHSLNELLQSENVKQL
ncbi:MAG TPA: polysaccharide deacetylase family protein [Candidatus Blautia excrementipullorum]|nr:polysaccharide deacetylase family protein [Candidatus Mediterraneibacter norwichensis]HJB16583.1 polysaccharide deacetylase family protein [Candidatus Blautia excrementipullorum]